MGRSQLQYRKPPKAAASAAAAAAAAQAKKKPNTSSNTPHFKSNIAPQPNRHETNYRQKTEDDDDEDDDDEDDQDNSYEASLKLRDGEYQTQLLRDKRIEAEKEKDRLLKPSERLKLRMIF